MAHGQADLRLGLRTEDGERAQREEELGLGVQPLGLKVRPMKVSIMSRGMVGISASNPFGVKCSSAGFIALAHCWPAPSSRRRGSWGRSSYWLRPGVPENSWQKSSKIFARFAHL
jgi:hypothetical protein